MYRNILSNSVRQWSRKFPQRKGFHFVSTAPFSQKGGMIKGDMNFQRFLTQGNPNVMVEWYLVPITF